MCRSCRERQLDHLVDALVTANPPKQETDEEHPFGPRWAWDPTDAKNWLAFLAHHLNVIGSRDLAWWQLSLAVPQRTSSLIKLDLGFGVVTAGWFRFLFVFGFDFAVVFAPLIRRHGAPPCEAGERHLKYKRPGQPV
jgi:hypothetical protein